jgi:hypothetical protein
MENVKKIGESHGSVGPIKIYAVMDLLACSTFLQKGEAKNSHHPDRIFLIPHTAGQTAIFRKAGLSSVPRTIVF